MKAIWRHPYVVSVLRVAVLLSLTTIYACQCARQSKCEWVMVPDDRNAKYAEEGYAIVCFRNYENNKQKCFLTIKLSLAEKIYGKKFKYSEVEFDHDKSPKEVLDIKACQPTP